MRSKGPVDIPRDHVVESEDRSGKSVDRRPSGRLLFLVVAGPLFVIYLLTATYSRPYNIDAFTNVLTAWEIADNGSPYLDDHEQLADPLYTGNVG